VGLDAIAACWPKKCWLIYIFFSSTLFLPLKSACQRRRERPPSLVYYCNWEHRVSGKILARKSYFAGPPTQIDRAAAARDRKIRRSNARAKNRISFGLEKSRENQVILARKMTVSEADLDALVVGTGQLAATLDVSKNYVVVLTIAGILEPLKKPVSEAALPAARLRKFQAEAILRTIAAQDPLRGVRDMLSRMIHRCRAKLMDDSRPLEP